MSYTKGDLVEMALEEIGIASYEYDVSPEQRQSAVRRLDAMMADWNARNIRLYFPIATSENSNVDDDSGIPDWAWTAVATNLAIQIAPSYGKQVSSETRINAKNAFNTLLGVFAQPKEAQFNSMPKGAGYKSLETRWTPEPEDKQMKQLDEEIDPSGVPE